MYLSAQVIAAMDSVRRVHFLNPGAIRGNKSIGDAAGLKNIGVHLITIAPGDRSTEYHFHHYEEECVYVLSGRGTAVMGDQTHPLGPGDFLGHPIDKVAHEMINDGTAGVSGDRAATGAGHHRLSAPGQAAVSAQWRAQPGGSWRDQAGISLFVPGAGPNPAAGSVPCNSIHKR
jgi:uncharacterized cupin superfamily protein